MPSVSGRRVIDAPAEAIWAVVSDPHHLPRWWPRVIRVEDVRQAPGGRRSQWTAVLQTRSGRLVRADYRCVSAAARERFVWEQQLEGTPFEKILRASALEIRLRSLDGSTEVTLESRQALRGLSRLGSAMMRRATSRTLDEALDSLAAVAS